MRMKRVLCASLSTRTVPPCNSMMVRTMARPSPVQSVRQLPRRVELANVFDELRMFGAGEKQEAFDHARQAIALFHVRREQRFVFVRGA